MRHASGLFAALAVLAAAGPAGTVMPASREQIFCYPGTAIVGAVLATRSHDCRLTSADPKCLNRDIVGVTVRVDEVWDPAETPLKKGDRVDVALRAYNPETHTPVAQLLSGHVPDRNAPPGDIDLGGIGQPIAAADVSEVLIGRHMIFTLTAGDKGRPPWGEPYFATIWPLSDRAWGQALWPTPACRAWAQPPTAPSGMGGVRLPRPPPPTRGSPVQVTPSSPTPASPTPAAIPGNPHPQ